MPTVSRRTFGLMVGAGATSLALPYYARAQGKPRAVVIGGGAGGATAARYMAKDAGEDLNVTLIEANPQYTTCFFLISISAVSAISTPSRTATTRLPPITVLRSSTAAPRRWTGAPGR